MSACECGCGEQTPVAKSTDRRRGYRKGEHKRFVAGHVPRTDLTGQRFGRLVVTARAESRRTAGGQSKAQWHATCDCGNVTVAAAASLVKGGTRSCGCLQSELRVLQGKANRKDAPGYSAAHGRNRRERGKPTEYPCVDCGETAAQWSYDHLDPDELTEEVTGAAGRIYLITYSADPAHYEPRCHSCHGRFDAAVKRLNRSAS